MTPHFESLNPFTNEVFETHPLLSHSEIDNCLTNAVHAFEKWKTSAISQRIKVLESLALKLRERKADFAILMAEEMGKPISQGEAEIDKCTWVCQYYAEHGVEFLKDEHIQTEAQQSFVRHQPLGTVLAIMPWNFPFWQLFRFAAPALIGGNTILLKHSPNTQACAKAIVKLFDELELPKGFIQNLCIDLEDTQQVIADKRVKALTLTGSVRAGRAIGALAGHHIKKTVLELGGNNAFLVFDDADLDLATESCFLARFLNTGQSCIAAKRIILHEHIANQFIEAFKAKVSHLTVKNPLLRDTFIGPMARVDLATELSEQLQQSVDQGATLVTGGKQHHAHFEPSLLINVPETATAFNEETFGPLAAITTVKSNDETIQLANQTHFGLGTSLYTADIDKAKHYINQLNGGAVFINEMVKSDPRLPFGGTGLSGYGRELGKNGIYEFLNTQTVYIR